MQIATAIAGYSVYIVKKFSPIVIVQGPYWCILNIYEGLF